MSSNDKNRFQRNIVNPKRGRSYPAVLIGRLGVNREFQNTPSHIGRQLMSFIKDWFRHEDNKTGCRFIVVDAYNDEKVLRYYEKNGFVPLYKTEELEKLYYDIPQGEHLKTRLLYFDLKRK